MAISVPWILRVSIRPSSKPEAVSKISYFQDGQGASVRIAELHAASHLPQKLQARLKGQRGLHQLEPCLVLGHSKLEILYVTVYLVGTVYPNMRRIAFKSKEAQQELCFFLVQEILFGTAAVIRINS